VTFIKGVELDRLHVPLFLTGALVITDDLVPLKTARAAQFQATGQGQYGQQLALKVRQEI